MSKRRKSSSKVEPLFKKGDWVWYPKDKPPSYFQITRVIKQGGEWEYKLNRFDMKERQLIKLSFPYDYLCWDNHSKIARDMEKGVTAKCSKAQLAKALLLVEEDRRYT